MENNQNNVLDNTSSVNYYINLSRKVYDFSVGFFGFLSIFVLLNSLIIKSIFIKFTSLNIVLSLIFFLILALVLPICFFKMKRKFIGIGIISISIILPILLLMLSLLIVSQIA